MFKPAIFFIYGLSCLLAVLMFSTGAVAEEEIISLNKATLEEIKVLFVDELDIPEKLAKSLVDFRNANGSFKTPEDLIRIPGMTQDFIEEINPQFMDGDVVFDPDAEPALAPSKC